MPKNKDKSSDVSIKEYFDQRIGDLEESIKLQFKLGQVALDKAQQANEARLNSMNEFRDQLRDQAAKFVTRNEVESIVERINENIKNLEISRAVLEGKASQQGLMVTAGISFLGLMIGIIGLVLKIYPIK